MPDRKESVTQAQIEAELSGEYRPVYLVALGVFLKVFFFVYDAVVYIPFKVPAFVIPIIYRAYFSDFRQSEEEARTVEPCQGNDSVGQ